MEIQYKITMHSHGTAWTVMDIIPGEKRALKELQAYRDLLPNRVFRLEKHTMEVMDA